MKRLIIVGLVILLSINNGYAAPEQVTGLTNTSYETNYIYLVWDACTDPEFLEYRIYRNSSLIYEITNEYYNDTELTEGTLYQYDVCAFNTSNFCGPYGSLNVYTKEIPLPPQPKTNAFYNLTIIIRDLTSVFDMFIILLITIISIMITIIFISFVPRITTLFTKILKYKGDKK